MTNGRDSRTLIVCAILVLTGGAGLPAEEESAEEVRHHVHGHHETHPNTIGVFVGVTAGGEEEDGGREDATGTIGIEYERRLSRLLGIGVVAEFAGGERREHVGVVPLTFRPGRRAKFLVGAGWERAAGSSFFGGETEPLARLGFMYAFDVVPGNHVSPGLNVDFLDGNTLVVVGATIGWGF
jgi:hypothetical protein